MSKQIFRNKKNNNLYEVLNTLPDYTNSREGQWAVIYQQIDNPHVMGIREEQEFHQKFEEVQ